MKKCQRYTNAKIPSFYPDEFSDDPDISIKDLKVGDTITVRIFFRVDDGEDISADSGYMDLEVEQVGKDTVVALILTELAEEFVFGAGYSIEINEDEILYRNKVTEH